VLTFILPSYVVFADEDDAPPAAADPVPPPVVAGPTVDITGLQPATPFNFQFEVVYENEYAQLLLDERNNNIRVYFNNGVYFDTLVMNGQVGNIFTRNNQRSDFNLEIYRSLISGATMNMDSFSNSVAAEQVTYTLIDGGVRADFMLGDADRVQLTMFPRQISRERLEEFVLDHMTPVERDVFTAEFYRFTGGRFLRAWPTVVAATGEPYPIPLPRLRRLHEAFYELGTYTFEELAYDNEYWEEDEFVPAPLVYLSVEYRLEGRDLVVTIPHEFMQAVEHQPFSAITVLPYFLSASVHDEGYIFIPDGSGGIIQLNNGMIQEAVLPVFGSDPLYQQHRYEEPFLQATLPIFGIVRNNTAILAIIEEGASVATIMANASGRIDEFNRVYAAFELKYRENVHLRGTSFGAFSPRYLDEPYEINIQQRFIFLFDEDANYVGMARAYREYLLRHGLLNSNPLPQDAPFFVDFIASTPRERILLGFIPNTYHFAMTSTSDMQNILTSLQNSGVHNIFAQYSHWANGGMIAGSLDNLSPLRSIGGARGMRELNTFAADNDINLFPAVQVITMRNRPGMFGRTRNSMLSRNIGNLVASIPWRQMHSRLMGGVMWMLSPTYWASYASRIMRGFSNLGLNNIAVTDLGSVLFGNYARREQISRLDALEFATQTLDLISGDMNLLLINPNAYAFRYANAITDLPFMPGGRRIVDFNIPFVQMVLGNHIPFSMPAYNADAMSWRGFEEYMLRAVESRSGLKLILTSENEWEFYQTFWDSGFFVMNNLFFQTEYERHWTHRIGEYYTRFNEFYRAVIGAEVVSHEVFGERVIVGYDNGVYVFINYSNTAWLIQGLTVEPLSFVFVS